MDLSVVVPTLNAQERLEGTLDALEASAPDAEVIVVNGPSSDGTSGLVRDHSGADLLLELSERNLNASRNAGIAASTGDVVSFVGQDTRIEEGWVAAIDAAMGSGAAVVTGPVHRRVNGGVTTESLETEEIGGETVRYFDGGNVAFDREVVELLDGFDEYLHTGASRDAAHRLASLSRRVVWQRDMVVLREEADDVFHRVGDDAPSTVMGLKYRSLAYRLTKNYGFGVDVSYRLARHLVGDGVREAWEVVRGDGKPSEWIGTGRSVLTNSAVGVQDGIAARMADRSPRRNPNGVSSTVDRPVAKYDL
ncbi:MAG: glycosyltransferase family 2 protein [Halodesulfurarchaeum sp.]